MKTRATPVYPQSDRMMRSFNATPKIDKSVFVSDPQTDWNRHISLFLLAYHSFTHEVTDTY